MKYARYGHSVAVSDPQIGPAEATLDPDLLLLLGHWEQLAAARPPGELPLRAVASSGIARLLKFTHLCDVIDGGADFRFRIVGISAFPNFEPLAGKLVSEHPDMGARHRFPILMREVVRTRRPVRGLAFRETEHANYWFESLWLPFGTTDVRQILGLMIPKSEEAR